MKSLGGTAVWTASSTLMKIGVGLLLVKLFALQFGAEGLGEVANFMTLITVLGVFAGGGIFNGVTKYVAEYEENPTALASLLSTSQRIVLGFSALLAVIFVLFSAKISEWLFYSDRYQTVILATAIAQFGIALSNYLLAILKGYRNAKAVALSTIIGVLLGLIVFVAGMYGFGYVGALIGLVAMPALTFLPAYAFLKRQNGEQAVGFLLRSAKFNRKQALNLAKFSFMVFVTAVTLPLAYVLLRNCLLEHGSLKLVGLWQGVSKISDAYLQFITVAFSVYLLPTFAKLTDKKALAKELVKSLKIVALAVVVMSLTVYLLRHWIILLLYSDDFLAMEDLFLWQLVGDVFKVLAYVFGYLIVAKASLRLYLLAELGQFALLVGSGFYLIPQESVLGATQSYALTYLCYFIACVAGFVIYLRRKPLQNSLQK